MLLLNNSTDTIYHLSSTVDTPLIFIILEA